MERTKPRSGRGHGRSGGTLADAQRTRVRKLRKLLAEHEPAPLPAELAARIDELVGGFTPEA